MVFGTMTCYDATNFDTTPGLESPGSTHLTQCGGGKRRSKRRSTKHSSRRRSSRRRISMRMSKSKRIRRTRRHFRRSKRY